MNWNSALDPSSHGWHIEKVHLPQNTTAGVRSLQFSMRAWQAPPHTLNIRCPGLRTISCVLTQMDSQAGHWLAPSPALTIAGLEVPVPPHINPLVKSSSSSLTAHVTVTTTIITITTTEANWPRGCRNSYSARLLEVSM